MKIALIDPSLFTWPYDVALAQGLAANGNQVMVFGRHPGRALPPAEAPYLRQHFYPGFHVGAIKDLPKPLFLGLKGLSHIESMLRLVRTLRTWKPDVIHFQWTPLAIIDRHFVAPLRKIAPVVLTVHDSAPFNTNPSAKLQRVGATDIMRQFDRLIVHTASAKARLETYGVASGRINIIPHGLLGTDAKPTPYVAKDTVTMLLFGQIKPYKGVDVLLRALALLPSAIKQKARVRIVGKPHMDMQPLLALTEQLNLRSQVDFDMRFVPDEEVETIMAQADIQLFPYREIDASGVLMLAIVAGRAMVASDIGLFRELLQDGVHGALVKPDDPAALASALIPLIENAHKRGNAAAAVKALAEAIPTWQEIARRTMDVYGRA